MVLFHKLADIGNVGNSHALTKKSANVFLYASDLENIKFEQEMYEPWHSNGHYEYGTGNYKASGNLNGGSFDQVTKPNKNGFRTTYKQNLTDKDYHL